ncbi:MAG TPA: alkaline phosphatase PhoX, partial [Thermoleophilaceae bacterium]|nr:alkaline phosphatase PhoX [Thermoleophilaceae bacterium]
MTSISRRAFLARSATAVGALSLAGPFRAYAQSQAAAEAVPGEGYGELVDRGGLALPDGFDYRVVSHEGEPMSDGNPTPSRFDGMAAFAGAGGTTVLLRNHENQQSHLYPFPAFEVPVVVPAARRYDPALQFNGGDTKLVLDPHGR